MHNLISFLKSNVLHYHASEEMCSGLQKYHKRNYFPYAIAPVEKELYIDYENL